MIVFATLYFSSPKVVVQKEIQTVTNTVTNEVVKEVPKEVEKIVTVPAEIPQDYTVAMNTLSNFVSNYDNASWVDQNEKLFGMTNVQVKCFLDDAAKQLISEDEVQSKFELTLRRNNVPINPKSQNTVFVSIEGTRLDLPQEVTGPTTGYFFVYNVNVGVDSVQTVFRGGQFHRTTVTVWEKQDLGYAGSRVANGALLDSVEKEGELFASDFLSANPKSP